MHALTMGSNAVLFVKTNQRFIKMVSNALKAKLKTALTVLTNQVSSVESVSENWLEVLKQTTD